MPSDEDVEVEMSKPADGSNMMDERLLPRLQLHNKAMLSWALKGIALMILLLCTSIIVSTVAYVHILGKFETLDTTSTPRLARYNVSNNIESIPEVMQEIGFTNEALVSYLNAPRKEICFDDTQREIDCNAKIEVDATGTAVGPESSSRRLALKAIGLKALGNLVMHAITNPWSNTQRSTNYWAGAVPDDGSHSGVWPHSREWRPMGRWSPGCYRWITFGLTQSYSVDWSVSWDYDGQYITNARVFAAPWAGWGFQMEARVRLGAAPVMRLIGGKQVAEVQIILELRGGSNIEAWAYKDIAIRLRGDGSAEESATGALC